MPHDDDSNDEAAPGGRFRPHRSEHRACTYRTRAPYVVRVAAHLRKCDGVPTTGDVEHGSTQRGRPSGRGLAHGRGVRETAGQRVTSVKCAFGKVRGEGHAEDLAFALVEYVVRKSGVVLTAAPAVDNRPLEERILSRLKLGPRTKSKLAEELGLGRGALQPAIDAFFVAEPRRIRGADVLVKNKNGSRVCSGLDWSKESTNDARFQPGVQP